MCYGDRRAALRNDSAESERDVTVIVLRKRRRIARLNSASMEKFSARPCCWVRFVMPTAS